MEQCDLCCFELNGPQQAFPPGAISDSQIDLIRNQHFISPQPSHFTHPSFRGIDGEKMLLAVHNL